MEFSDSRCKVDKDRMWGGSSDKLAIEKPRSSMAGNRVKIGAGVGLIATLRSSAEDIHENAAPRPVQSKHR